MSQQQHKQSFTRSIPNTYPERTIARLATSTLVVLQRYTLKEETEVLVQAEGFGKTLLSLPAITNSDISSLTDSNHNLIYEHSTIDLHVNEPLLCAISRQSNDTQSDIPTKFHLRYSEEHGTLKLQLEWASADNENYPIEDILDSICHSYSQERKINHLDILPNNIADKIFNEFNGKKINYPQKNLSQLIKEQCQKTPNNTAYKYEQERLSYQELDEFSNSLANQLTEHGVRKGDLVPYLMENCLELPIAIVGLMKIGAVFIPVDPQWPEPRIEASLDRIKCKYVLSNEPSDRPCFSNLNQIGIKLCEMKREPEGPEVELNPDDLLYGFFTSGSTGTPKCALNYQKGIVNRFHYMTERFSLSTNDVILQNSKNVFDSSLWQLLWPLTNGNTVIIPKPNNALNLDDLISIIEQEKITITDFVPSIFNLLVEYLHKLPTKRKPLLTLKNILIGGEEANNKYIQIFQELYPKTTIINTYGHTEASIGMVFGNINVKSGQTIPLGNPIPNTYAIVLDKHQNLSPIGVKGEIYVGGSCLGAGYYDDAQKNNQTYVKNPFSKIPGKLLFRTGDYGYWGKDGKLHYLGRGDNQVKVGGVRIELNEIEIEMLKIEEIKEVKVILRKNNNIDTITAFYVSETPLDYSHIRNFIKRKLPKSAIPNMFRHLNKMPLNHNGKADLQALTGLTSSDSKENNTSASGTQKKLIHLWEKLLGYQGITPSDDFFMVGGNSILAMSMLIEIKKEFRKTIDLEKAYSDFTIQNLSKLINLKEDKEEQDNNTTNNADSTEAFYKDIEIKVDRSVEHRTDLSKTEKNYFITGSSGFFGTHILSEILSSSNCLCYCHVRAESNIDGFEKIKRSLKHYNLWDDNFPQRIKVITGDLSRPNLGIAPNQWADLCNNIDVVVANGSEVNFVKNYQTLRKANVASTIQSLELLKSGKPKSLHYVSTLETRDFASQNLENDKKDYNNLPANGYTLTKLASEIIIKRHQEAGYQVSIARFGELMPSSNTGIPNKSAISHFFWESLVSTKCYPQTNTAIDYTPVDFAAKEFYRQLNLNTEIYYTKGLLLRNVFKCYPTFKEVPYSEYWHLQKREIEDNTEADSLNSIFFFIPKPCNKAKDPISEIFSTHRNSTPTKIEQNHQHIIEDYILKSLNKYIKFLGN